MARGESIDVRQHDCPNCNYFFWNSLDMITDELQKVINEYGKICACVPH